MTPEDIIRMAREAGLTVVDSDDPQCWAGQHAADDESLERFAALVAAAERQRCAQIAREWDAIHQNTNYGGCIARLIEGDME
jgi:hypothetical protein